jgi:PAT family beta-lactamase induction signal transducer AmpG
VITRDNPYRAWYYYIMFGLLYFVQGSALAYINNFQKPYLDSLNISAGRIGLLTSVLLIPFILKIFIGMLSDKVNLFRLGNRKPYILTGLILGTIAFMAVSRVLPDRNFLFFSVLIFMGSLSVALFDTCTDGFAIEISPEKHYGRVQSIMISGKAVGFIVLSLVFGYMVQKSSYSAIFIIIGLLMMIPFIFVVFASEPAEIRKENQFEWGAFRLMIKPVFLVFALYAIFYSIVSFGVDGIMTFFMSNELDAPVRSIGQYGALRGVGAIIGALIGGLSMDRLNYKRVAYLTIFIVSTGACLMGFASNISTVLSFAIAWGFAWGLQEAVFFYLAMRLTDVRIAASMFAIMVSLSNIGTAITNGVCTTISINVGFQLIFFILAGFNVINLGLLYYYFRIWKPAIRRK